MSDSITDMAYLESLFALQKKHASEVDARSVDQRINSLRRLREVLLSRRESIGNALAADFGKPRAESDLTELATLLIELQQAIRHIRRWTRPIRPRTPLLFAGTSSRIHHVPKGTVLILSPWNYPLLLALGPLISAVAAGNCAVIKPSEYAPHTGALVKELVEEVFDKRHVAVVRGDFRTAEALTHMPFNHIFFTGSTAIGSKVLHAAADNLTPVTLELGGKSPAIVDETADPTDTAAIIAFGAFANAGQSCITPDYILVQEDLAERLAEALAQRVRHVYGATSELRQRSDQFARIVSDSHYQRIKRALEEAVAAGARLVIGGQTVNEERYIEPSVLLDVPADCALMREEIFGPVLPILTYRQPEDAVERILRYAPPLSVYLFSRNRVFADRIIHEIPAGGIVVNDTMIHFSHPQLPFGGLGESGMGRAHGRYGFETFSNLKPVLKQRLRRPPLQLLQTPYTERSAKLMNLLLRFLSR